jgi:hypothetical protein
MEGELLQKLIKYKILDWKVMTKHITDDIWS